MALGPRQLVAKIVITYAEDCLHIAVCYPGERGRLRVPRGTGSPQVPHTPPRTEPTPLPASLRRMGFAQRAVPGELLIPNDQRVLQCATKIRFWVSPTVS
jgi:hypothetical protein